MDELDQIINDLQSSKLGSEETSNQSQINEKDKKAPKMVNPMFEEFGTARAPPVSFQNRDTIGDAENVIKSLQRETKELQTTGILRPQPQQQPSIMGERERNTIAEVDRLIDDLESMNTTIPSPLDRESSSPGASPSSAKSGKTFQAIPVASRETKSNATISPTKIAAPHGSARLVSKIAPSAPIPQTLPSCDKCKQPVSGNSVTIMGRVWHSEHFQCTKCATVLSPLLYHEKDGVPYCEKDYRELFSPKCSYCNGIITDKCINALGKSWHVDHFFCCQCGKTFENGVFLEFDGKAYCEEDYYSMFAPRCSACTYTIKAEAINALGKTWHPECFTCATCKCSFGNGTYFSHEGKPYCEVHYHEQKGTLCNSCMKPIVGKCVTAIGKRFHPEHFVCVHCLKQLASVPFREEKGKPYCVPCNIKLFG